MFTKKQHNQKTLDPPSSLFVFENPPDAESKPPAKSQRIDNDMVKKLEDESKELVKQLGEASGSQELKLIDRIAGIGLKAQRTAGADLDLLQTRIRDMLTQGKTSDKISNELIGLRMALNAINPHELIRKNFASKLLSRFPFFRVFDPGIKALKKMAIRYESVSNQVWIIEKKLREGRLMLTRDNLELRKLYEQIEEKQSPVQKNAYLGECIVQQLRDVIEHTQDPMKRNRLQNAMYDVSMRVQDLRTMEEIFLQFFVSIDLTRQNNSRLGQAVERTLTLATNLVAVGLAIQTALFRQKRVIDATQKTREFLGNLIVANAATIKQHTTDIGDVYNQPAIAIEKVTKAHIEIVEALEIAIQLKQKGIDNAQENVGKLTKMSSELQKRIGVR
ncbi:MAG: toxic anion resistance protein [Nitrospinales bacterium]